MTLAAGNLLTKSSARKAGRQGVVGRMDNSGATATKDVPIIVGTVTTDLRNGWMASPLVSQAFEPEVLDRCPRGVLQVLYSYSLEKYQFCLKQVLLYGR